MWLAAGQPHRGTGYQGSDFATLFVPAWDGLLPAQGGVVKTPAGLAEWIVEIAAAVLAGDSSDAISRHVAAARISVAALIESPGELRAPTRRRDTLARSALEAKAAPGVPLAALAADFDQSPSQFSRAFSEAWAIPPSQYRKQLRLLRATRLLLEGRTVTFAALEAGFSDAAHLSRTFHRQYGLSPSSWQRKLRTL